MKATVLAGLLLSIVGQQPALQLKNVQATYGTFGPVRAAGPLLPGDVLTLPFDIDGITVKDGKATYALSTEVLHQGKVQYRQPAKDQEVVLALGGNTLQGVAQFEVGLNTPPGEYEFKVSVTDSATKQTQSFTQKHTVAPKGFGIVRLTTTLDGDGEAHTTLLQAGQTLWVNCSAVGFERDKTSTQPNLSFTLTVLDAAGQPSGGKAFTGTVDKDVPAMIAALPGQFPLPLNRAGKFTVVVEATDNLAKKSSKLSFPIDVKGR